MLVSYKMADTKSLDQWLETAKQCQPLPEPDMKVLCDMVFPAGDPAGRCFIT